MPPLAANAAKQKADAAAKAKADAQRQKEEAERQAAERLKAMVKERIAGMKLASPADADRSHQWVKSTCTDKRLSADFKKWAQDQAKKAECASNMRATDAALDDAVRLAQQERMKERAAKIMMAREFFAKACTLGANEEFKTAAKRLIDTAMLTGGIYTPGKPTRAKPIDTAPKNPHDAKAFNPDEAVHHPGAEATPSATSKPQPQPAAHSGPQPTRR